MFDEGFHTSFQIPRRREDHVARPRLTAELESHSGLRLQLVVAPAAYGKTTLLSEFARHSSRRACWFTLEDSDADVETFLRRVHYSVQVQFPKIAPLPAYSPASDGTGHARSLVANLVNAIQGMGDDPMTLIWDDFHRVSSEEGIQLAVNLMLDHMPSSCTLVIGSRTRPELETAERLFAYRDAHILTAQDLAFSASDIQALVGGLRGRDVSTAQAQEIRERTDGWAGGVLPPESRQRLQAFAMSAIGHESASERRLLEATSVLPYLSPDLCDALFEIDTGAELLSGAYRRIGFLAQTEEKTARYRWHDLIREGLEERFKAGDHATFVDVSVRAARIFESKGEVEHALALFAKADRHREASRLLAQKGEDLLRQGRWVFLERWLEQIPAEFVERDPALLELRGRIAARLRDGESALSFFNSAIPYAREAEDAVLEARILTSRSSTLQMLELYADAQEDASQALDLLEKSGGPGPEMTRVRLRLGSINLFLGHVREAEELLLEALPTVRTSGDAYETAYINRLLGWAYLDLGKVSEAQMYMTEAVSGWRKQGNLGERSVDLNNLAQLWHRQGQLETARELLEEALQCSRDSAYTRRLEAVVLVGLGDVARDSDDLDGALEHYRRGLDLAREASEANLVSHIICLTGETYRLKGDYEKANILIAQAEALARAQGQLYEQSLALIYLALLTVQREGSGSGAGLLEKAGGLLTRSGNPHAKALLDVCSAEIAFLTRDLDACEQALASLAARCETLGYSGFLAPEARRSPMMFQWAASKTIGGGLYGQIWESALNDRLSRGAARSQAPGRLSLELRAYSLGESRVLVGGERVPNEEWQSPKAKELLYYFMTQSSAVRKESIFAALWPDATVGTANNNFHSSLRRLRRAIHPAVVVLEDRAYELNPYMEVWLDLSEFLDRVARADGLGQGSSDRAGQLEAALSLYGGPFMEEFYSEWAETTRREAELMYLRTLSALAGFYAGQKEFVTALDLLERLANLGHLEEEARLQMMRRHLALGDATAAAHVYEEYRSVLRAELGASPSAVMQREYREAIAAI